MTAHDYETDNVIINPYIRIVNPETRREVFLNTLTFGERGQESIKDLDFYLSTGQSSLTHYEVWAVVGNYNFSPLNTVSHLLPEKSRTLLGFLIPKDIKEFLPKTFRFLNKKN